MKHKNINDFIEFNEEHLTKKIIYQDEFVLTFILNLRPGQKLPRHGHEGGTLTIEVLQGQGKVSINDEVAPLLAGQIYFLSGSDMLEVPEVSKDLSLLVNIAPNPANPIYRKPV